MLIYFEDRALNLLNSVATHTHILKRVILDILIMSSYKDPKSKIIVLGYVKQIINEYIPNDVIKIILQFYEHYFLFDTFDEEGLCIKNKSKIVDVNEYILFFRDFNDKLSYNSIERYFDSCQYERVSLLSQGLTNYHHFLYTCNNKLFGVGGNESNQIGISSELSVKEPILINISFDSVLIQICCGDQFSLFLTKNGNVYGTGNNEHNQLTKKYQSNETTRIQKIIDTSNIIRIGCCSYTTILLDSNGILRAFGEDLINVDIDSYNNILYNGIQEIHTSKVTNFSCGSYHIGYITDKNELYMKGRNVEWQCGRKYSNDIENITNQVNINECIIDIHCGGWNTVIKVKNNRFYSFGANTDNVLFHDPVTTSKNVLPALISNKYVMELTKSDQLILDIIPSRFTSYILQQSSIN